MNPMFLSSLGNHLWQSTVVAALAGLLTLILRTYSAHVRYWVWFTASVKFLVPCALLISLGSAVSWPTAKPIAYPPSIIVVATEIAQPFVVSTPVPLQPSAVGAMRQYVPILFFSAWLVGFLIIVTLWARGWWRMRAVIRSASPVVIPPGIKAMASPALLEPSVFGIFRPVLFLPRNIQERLDAAQLQSVLAHETCHIQRRDNLLSSIHMTVAAIFWFYPVIWWLGARLLEERERACDEQVVREGIDAHVYVEGILSVCRTYLESPLRCAPGVSGANLQKRIEAIISGRSADRLTFGRTLLLASAGLSVIAMPFAVGMIQGATLSQDLGNLVEAQQVPEWQEAPSGRRFEAASIKPNESGPPTVGPNGLLTTPFRLAPGGLFTGTNVTLVEVLTFLDIKTNQVQGGPAWIYSKRFDIIARADPAAGEVKGWTDGGQEQWKQMIRGLLEDRFKLKMHRETKDVAGLVLVAGKDSPKLQEYKSGPRGALQPGPSREMRFRGVPVSALAGYVSSILRTPVIDRTGMSGLFDFTLAPYQFAAAPIDGARDSALTFADLVRTAVEQLGLRLENAKVPMEMAIIDEAETPSEN